MKRTSDQFPAIVKPSKLVIGQTSVFLPSEFTLEAKKFPARTKVRVVVTVIKDKP